MESPRTRYLLTGATGFIGSEVFCQLLSHVEVEDIVLLGRNRMKSLDSLLGRRLLEHFEAPRAQDILDGLNFVPSDFTNEDKFQQSLSEVLTHFPGKFVVVHMAAQVKAPTAEKELQRRINVGVSEDLCRWSEAHASHFIFVSSVVAFGASRKAVVRSEADFPNFPWLASQMSYFETKRTAHEQILKAKVPAISVVCPSVVHGSLEEEKSSRGHLRAVKEGRLRFAPPGGINIVSLKYVSKNIVDLAINPKMKSRETYLLVGENVSTQSYLQKYQDLHGKVKGVQIARIPTWLGFPLVAIFTLLKLLRFPTSTSFETAIASFGFLFFKSQKFSPDEKVAY